MAVRSTCLRSGASGRAAKATSGRAHPLARTLAACGVASALICGLGAGQGAAGALAVGGKGVAAVAGDRVAAPDASQLMLVTYVFQSESSGGGAKAGSQVNLLFGAGDQAYVYLSNAGEAFGEPGTYSYSGGRLSLHVVSSDLDINATFPLDLSSSQVTMPFQVFSEKPGTSTWQEEPMPIDEGMMALYNAYTNTNSTVANTAGADQAYSYAEAWLSAQDRSGTLEAPAAPAARTAGAPGLSMRTGGKAVFRALAGATPALHWAPCGTHCVAGVVNLGDDILVQYRNGTAALVSLYNAGASVPAAPLTMSPLASDPRVFLDPTTHPDSQFNPTNKEAVLIAPVADIESPEALADLGTVLRSRGYVVKQLLNSDATILGIVTLLKANPGFVLFSSHGNEGGQLQTGDVLSTEGVLSASVASAAYKTFATELSSYGLKSLTTYKVGGTKAYFVDEPNCSYVPGQWLSTYGCKWKVVITPVFWDWLENTQGVSFAHSLVFISACETDHSSSPGTVPSVLASQIKARAYFAFSEDVAAPFATAVERYLAEALYRPTHSPEEVFYNLVRVERTHQMIYKEDRLLEGTLGASGSDASVDILDGWGWNGSALVSYRNNGWLGGKVDPAQVWWMLYAARWVKDTTQAAAGLNACYTQYWSHGNPGGLASAYCNAANAGIPKDPTSLKIDVAYAIYLLNGTEPAGFSPDQLPPRWTLDD